MRTVTKRAALAGVVAASGLAAVLLAGGAGKVEQAAAAPAGQFAIDPVHTTVVFKIQRLTGAPFYGTFKEVKGSFLLDAADAGKSSLSVEVPTASIDSNNPGRDKHLKSQDFFSAEEFPTLSFQSTAVKKTGEKEFEAAGTLSLRGQSKPVTVKLRETGSGSARGGGTMVGYDVTFAFKRSEFGMTKYSEALGDEVTIIAGLEGVKK